MLRKLWGRPPGLRGTPPSRSRHNGIGILPGASRPTGTPAPPDNHLPRASASIRSIRGGSARDRAGATRRFTGNPGWDLAAAFAIIDGVASGKDPLRLGIHVTVYVALFYATAFVFSGLLVWLGGDLTGGNGGTLGLAGVVHWGRTRGGV